MGAPITGGGDIFRALINAAKAPDVDHALSAAAPYLDTSSHEADELDQRFNNVKIERRKVLRTAITQNS